MKAKTPHANSKTLTYVHALNPHPCPCTMPDARRHIHLRQRINGSKLLLMKNNNCFNRAGITKRFLILTSCLATLAVGVVWGAPGGALTNGGVGGTLTARPIGGTLTTQPAGSLSGSTGGRITGATGARLTGSTGGTLSGNTGGNVTGNFGGTQAGGTTGGNLQPGVGGKLNVIVTGGPSNNYGGNLTNGTLGGSTATTNKTSGF